MSHIMCYFPQKIISENTGFMCTILSKLTFVIMVTIFGEYDLSLAFWVSIFAFQQTSSQTCHSNLLRVLNGQSSADMGNLYQSVKQVLPHVVLSTNITSKHYNSNMSWIKHHLPWDHQRCAVDTIVWDVML